MPPVKLLIPCIVVDPEVLEPAYKFTSPAPTSSTSPASTAGVISLIAPFT